MLYIGVPDWCLVLLDVFQSGVWFWWKLGFRQRFGFILVLQVRRVFLGFTAE